MVLEETREREKRETEEPEDLSDVIERAGKEARLHYRAELARRVEWEPYGRLDQRAAVEAAREKAREQWVREQEEGEKAAIMAAKEHKKAARMAECEALEQKLTILPRERQELVEQYVPEVLETVRENLDRFKAQYDALGETIKAHTQTKPAQPEEPK